MQLPCPTERKLSDCLVNVKDFIKGPKLCAPVIHSYGVTVKIQVLISLNNPQT